MMDDFTIGTIVIGTDLLRRGGQSLEGQIFRVERQWAPDRWEINTPRGQPYHVLPSEVKIVGDPVLEALFEAWGALEKHDHDKALEAVKHGTALLIERIS